ncbi:MAG: resolvase [Lachnospiraceae bacterium]|nr:resolvase [Lachnospiraceae bacterium]
MNGEVEKFIYKMSEFLPMVQQEYAKNDKTVLLETVFVEDIIMPEIIRLLIDGKNIDLLTKIFQYIEEIVINNEYVRDILSVTMFEILGNDIAILRKAQQYMGENSKILQIEADKQLGRV